MPKKLNTIILGELNAEIDTEVKLFLRQSLASGDFDKNETKIPYEITQSITSGHFIFDIKGKYPIIVSLKDIAGLVISKYDEIPDRK